MESPEVFVAGLGILTGLVGLSFRGAKAKFTDEVLVRIDEKFEAHAQIDAAKDEAVSASIESLKGNVADLKSDVSEVKADVRVIAQEIRALASRNGQPKMPIGATDTNE